MTLHVWLTVLFSASIWAMGYVYFGYPLLLRLGFFGRQQPLRVAAMSGEQPMISIIIAAHNEEAGIEAKLRNLLASKYPRERMEILVGSDGSSDRTEAIVRPLAAEGVGLISFPQHQGKSAIQNRLVAAASGSILVFTDADCLLSPDALNRLVENFRDPRIGLVTGRPAYLNRADTQITANESIYLDYETWLREQESALGILAMASGSLFAVRRSLWKSLDRHVGDDFALPLHVARSGFRNILEICAIATTHLTQNTPSAMLRLKVRIVSKDFRALLAQPALLNPFRAGRLALGLWSHKILRWFVPYFLIATFVTSVTLSAQPVFRAIAALQCAFYVIALAGLLQRRVEFRAPWSIPASFCLVNLAALLGTLKCFAGHTSGQWEPRRAQSLGTSVSENSPAFPESK
jgi:cellulose synthase/poly-beta-1,6-N-acetylglucosamine synthase-like glycosyltransferase